MIGILMAAITEKNISPHKYFLPRYVLQHSYVVCLEPPSTEGDQTIIIITFIVIAIIKIVFIIVLLIALKIIMMMTMLR